jgi:hypothetical protein
MDGESTASKLFALKQVRTIYLSERYIALIAVFVCPIMLDGTSGKFQEARVRTERDVLSVTLNSPRGAE